MSLFLKDYWIVIHESPTVLPPTPGYIHSEYTSHIPHAESITTKTIRSPWISLYIFFVHPC
jgi:hypothetical protein